MKLVIPPQLKKYGNGQIPRSELKTIRCGGEMWKWAAFCFDMMYDAAKKDGVVFRNIGDYRPLPNQERMFMDRYSPKPTLRKPRINRVYKGKVWWLKKGKSPSATPGKSPHGWGLAIDLDVKNPVTFNWLKKNASKYGFYLQNEDPKSKEYEAWHWQYCLGNKLPQVAKEALAAFIAATATASGKSPS